MSLLGSQANRNNASNSDPFASNRKLCHFYVVIPPEDQALSQDFSKAVSSAKELAVIMKRNPHARFQSASTAEEAMKKALEKIQFCKDTESIPSPRTERKKGRSSLSAVEGSLGAPSTPSPKTEELLMLGREILTKQNDKALERIDKNPRILCTDAEYPTILQEGCKLNALHLAAKSGNVTILIRILNYVSSMDFMRRIYPTLSEERLKSCSKHLSTCYLNTPDKMLQDTPLHFACKFNAVDCVEMLLNHPFCDTSLINYDKLTPYEVVGERDSKTGAKATSIRNFFRRRFIVPIWRDESVDGDAPVLGDVSFIPDLGQTLPPPLLSYKFPDFSLSLLEPCKAKLLPKTQSAHLKLFASNPPSWKVMAFAGPMEEKKANDYRKVMKRSKFFLLQNQALTPESSFNTSGNSDIGGCSSPPLSPKLDLSPRRSTPPPSNQLLVSPITSPISMRTLRDSPVRNISPLRTDMATRVRDVEKGLERIGFEYAYEMDIPWSEYWKFLGKYCDLASEEGLEMLERHLRSIKTKMEDDETSSELANSTNKALDDVIDKMLNMKLNGSGAASPDGKVGFCTNSKCRIESRFCNCDEVVPGIPYLGDNGIPNQWIFDDPPVVHNMIPFSGMSQQYLGIRKLNMTSNTDSFEASNENNSSDDFNWPSPDYIDVYQTAPSSPVDNDVFEDCLCGVPVYFNGNAPGKLDFQVFQVLKNCNGKLDRTQHLTTFQWLNSMHAHGNALALAAVRNHFSFNSTRQEVGGTPKPSWGPNFASTPGRDNKNDFDSSF